MFLVLKHSKNNVTHYFTGAFSELAVISIYYFAIKPLFIYIHDKSLLMLCKLMDFSVSQAHIYRVCKKLPTTFHGS